MTLRLKRTAAAGLAALLVLSLLASPAVARDTPRARWLKIRVYQNGATTPSVLVNLPMSLVAAVLRIAAKGEAHGRFDIGDDDGHGGRHHEIDLNALIEELEAMDPGQIIEIQDDDRKVSVWME